MPRVLIRPKAEIEVGGAARPPGRVPFFGRLGASDVGQETTADVTPEQLEALRRDSRFAVELLPEGPGAGRA